jgi:hypothetical protein
MYSKQVPARVQVLIHVHHDPEGQSMYKSMYNTNYNSMSYAFTGTLYRMSTKYM